MPTLPQPTAYSFLLLAAIVVSWFLLWRLRRRDADLLTVYLVTLAGAFLGAKVVYLLAEGWMFWDHPDRWQIWLTGKTILGALLFGYPAAELGKKLLLSVLRLALPVDFLERPHLAEIHIARGPAQFSVRADVLRPHEPRQQFIRLCAQFLQPQSVDDLHALVRLRPA